MTVLIYKPKDYYIDFSTFLKRKDLFKNIYELNFKINHVINNFENLIKNITALSISTIDSKNRITLKEILKIYKLSFKKENNKIYSRQS